MDRSNPNCGAARTISLCALLVVGQAVGCAPGDGHRSGEARPRNLGDSLSEVATRFPGAAGMVRGRDLGAIVARPEGFAATTGRSEPWRGAGVTASIPSRAAAPTYVHVPNGDSEIAVP